MIVKLGRTGKAVVVLSGGVDSTTLLYDTVKTYGKENVFAFSVDYGQRHSQELLAAIITCTKKVKVNHKVLDLSSLKEILTGSSLTSDGIDTPHGHYEDENMKMTVVPNRNMILLSLAIGYAISKDADVVLYGAHSGDHQVYPDCRPDFITAMQNSARVCHYTPVLIDAPYSNIDKAGIVKIGIELGVDYSITWTCYEGGSEPCGLCGSCRERIEAFLMNGLQDSFTNSGNQE